jgi:hydroxypyruvate reductase
MRRSYADVEGLLANNDSNKALASSGDLIITGPTGTNVNDLIILLIEKTPA